MAGGLDGGLDGGSTSGRVAGSSPEVAGSSHDGIEVVELADVSVGIDGLLLGGSSSESDGRSTRGLTIGGLAAGSGTCGAHISWLMPTIRAPTKDLGLSFFFSLSSFSSRDASE